MARRKKAAYMAINIGFLLLNLRLWTYSPPTTNENSDISPGADFEHYEYYEKNIGENKPDRQRQDTVYVDGLRHLKKTKQYTQDVQQSEQDYQDSIVQQYRMRHPNSSVQLPETDVYVTPPTIKEIPERNYWRSRRGYTVPSIQYTNLVNCAKLLRNDTQELDKAKSIMASRPFFKVPIYEERYLEWTKDCKAFRQDRGYIQVPLTKEEEEFPMAFSIAMYTDVEQTERLLRAIYQPQNLYCIHIDTKSSNLIHRTVRAIANCFDNVWIATHLDKIKWGDISVVLPEINCMRDLVKYYGQKTWKYFINLTGQEFPLRTNYELVQIAKIFNGSNDIGGSESRMDMDRVNYRWTHRWSITYQQTIFYNTFEPHPPPPFNVKFVKGELHGLFSRNMVFYIVDDERAKSYLQWCWDTGHPSEHFWNVLNHNKYLQAPGGYEGSPELADKYAPEPMVRVKNWVGLYDNRTCQGKVVRGICVYGVDDAPWIASRPELFANKFHLTYEYLGYDCLEELHRNRTKLKEKVPFKRRIYERLPTVLYSRKDGLPR